MNHSKQFNLPLKKQKQSLRKTGYVNNPETFFRPSEHHVFITLPFLSIYVIYGKPCYGLGHQALYNPRNNIMVCSVFAVIILMK